MSTTTNKPVKFIGLFMIIAGLFMIIAGGATWVTVQSQLKAENILVAKVTDQNPGRLAGKPVAGPFTAYAQANAIKEHALAGAGGRTYAEIGKDATDLKTRLEAAGANKDQVAENTEVKELDATRTSTMNGSFLRASLFTSVVSFGVAALVMGLGLLFMLLGFALGRLSKTTVPTTAAASAS